ncbi:MAG: BcsR/BcsP family cellulose biosynthesis protein [Pusillimonas sp.]
MKELSDVTKLFARFGGDKATQYREVREADQHSETHERWPLFKQVQVGFGRAMPQASEAIRPTEPSGRAAGSAAFDALMGANRQQPAAIEPLAAVSGIQPGTQAPRPAFVMASPSVEQAAGQDTNDAGGVEDPGNMPARSSDEDGRSLRSLFLRLDNPHQPAAIADPPAPSDPGQQAGSIRSLFDRLHLS